MVNVHALLAVGVNADGHREILGVDVIGAVLAEQHDEWTEGRRYLGLDVLARSRISLLDGDTTKEVSDPMTPEAISA